MFQTQLKKIYVIASPLEDDQRRANVERLNAQLPNLIVQPAIFPSIVHVPFLEKMQDLSEKRTGLRMNPGEIGVLLANRAIWRTIAKETEGWFLILESDSTIPDPSVLASMTLLNEYDIFFFGGWYGKILLKRSTVKKHGDHRVGEAVFKTISGCYGYAINVKAAKALLTYTKTIAHPVDEFKRYLPEDLLRIGAILPEVICELPSTSSIGHPDYENIRFKTKMILVNLRNQLKAFFS